MGAILLIGVAPKYVDPNDPAVPPGVTPASVAKGIEQTLEEMHGRGWAAEHCAISPDATAESKIADCLAERARDVVVIGAGIRVPPQYLDLFERVVNAVRQGAPDAAIAFNSSPETSTAAAERWLGMIG